MKFYSDKGDQPSAISKRLKSLVSFVNWCIKQEYTNHKISFIPFNHNFEKEVAYLIREEVLQLYQFEKFIFQIRIIKINDQSYMLIGGGGNVEVFVSDKNLIIVDNKYEIIEEVLMYSLSEISSNPSKYIINTHYHHNYSDRNRAFGKMGIPIISHENIKARMQKVIEMYGGIYDFIDSFVQDKYPTEVLTIITYNSKPKLSERSEDIEMYNFGSGHTLGDSIIYFKNANILHIGDGFVRYGYPYVDLNNGGSIKGIMEVLGSIAALADDQTVIMPGHGNFSSIQDVLDLRNSLMHL